MTRTEQTRAMAVPASRHPIVRTAIAATITALATAMLATTLHAQTTAPAARSPQSAVETITFDEALRLALQRNVAVKTAENATAIDAATVQQQKLSFLPSLALSGNTSQNVGRNFSESDGVMIDQTSQAMSAGLSSSVTLFDGLKSVDNLRSARASAQASESELTRTRQTAVFTVASNYLTLVTAQGQLAVQEQSLAAQQQQLAQIQAYVNAGTRPIADLYQQQAAVASAQSAIVDARTAVEKSKVDLMQTLQLDPRATYDFQAPAIANAATATPLDLDSLVARALGERADLDAQESRVAAASQNVKAASAARLPTVSLSAGYNTAFTTTATPSFLDQLNERRGGSVAIGISIPLFDKGSTAIATQKAQIAEENARLALESQKQQVALDVRRAWLDYQAAQQRLAAAQAQQTAAQAALTATQQRYDAGKATLVEVTQARTTQLQAATALVSARYSVVFQRALMGYYTGDLAAGTLSLQG